MADGSKDFKGLPLLSELRRNSATSLVLGMLAPLAVQLDDHFALRRHCLPERRVGTAVTGRNAGRRLLCRRRALPVRASPLHHHLLDLLWSFRHLPAW